MKKNISFKIIKILIGLSLALTILIGPVLMISFNRPYYDNYIAKNDFKSLQKEDASNIIYNILDFLMHKKELDDRFTENEKSHMNDVRKIFDVLLISYFISGALLISSIIFIKIKQKNLFLIIKPIKLGALSILILGLIIIVASLINFDSSFIVFHELFFPQGNWSFPETSLLITLFTEHFFYKTGIKIFTIVLIQAAILSAASIFFEYNNKKSKKPTKSK